MRKYNVTSLIIVIPYTTKIATNKHKQLHAHMAGKLPLFIYVLLPLIDALWHFPVKAFYR